MFIAKVIQKFSFLNSQVLFEVLSQPASCFISADSSAPCCWSLSKHCSAGETNHPLLSWTLSLLPLVSACLSGRHTYGKPTFLLVPSLLSRDSLSSDTLFSKSLAKIQIADKNTKEEAGPKSGNISILTYHFKYPSSVFFSSVKLNMAVKGWQPLLR